MPIYEYRCENGHLFEVMQKIADPPVTACERCGATVARVFHPIAVHFKGKGFYNTDYGTKKRQRENAKSEEGKKAESSSGESKSGGETSSGGESSAGSSESVSKAEPAASKSSSSSSDSGSSSGSSSSQKSEG